MFTLTILTKKKTTEFNNVIDIHVKEITYMQLQITIIHSYLEGKQDDIILDKKDLVILAIEME